MRGLETLKTELERSLALLGVNSIAVIKPEHVQTRSMSRTQSWIFWSMKRKWSVDAKLGKHRSRESRKAICRFTRAMLTRLLEVRRSSTVSLQSMTHYG